MSGNGESNKIRVAVYMMIQLLSYFPSISQLFLWKSVTGYVTILRTDLLLCISESETYRQGRKNEWCFLFSALFRPKEYHVKPNIRKKTTSLFLPWILQKKGVWKMSLVSKMVIFHFHDCWKKNINVETSNDFHGSENFHYPWDKSQPQQNQGFHNFWGSFRW